MNTRRLALAFHTNLCSIPLPIPLFALQRAQHDLERTGLEHLFGRASHV